MTILRAWALLLILSTPGLSWSRTPEIGVDPRGGVWIGIDEVVIHQSRDRWTVIPADAVVSALAVDDQTVWVGTDDGLVRFEIGSRRMSRFGMDEGLPSQVVTAVVADQTYVWIGTNKGLVRYRRLDREVRVFTDEDGLPHRAVNDLALAGRDVWIATRGGVAKYDPDVDGLRAYSTEDGLASDYVEELFAVGDDIWFLTEAGLSRLSPDSRRFSNFTREEIGGEEIRVFVPDGERIWVGTESGLSFYTASSDAFFEFPQLTALENRSIRGVEPFTDYLFITTDTELVQYHKQNRTFRRFTEADGLARENGAVGTVFSGGQLSLFFADGAEVLDVQRDLWTSRGLIATETTDASRLSTEAWTTIDSEVPIDLDSGRASDDRYGTLRLGGGVGYQLDEGRSLDVSGWLDYGEVELDGIRNFDVAAEYLGKKDDYLREVRLDDTLETKRVEEGVERPITLMGGHLHAATPEPKPTYDLTVDGGVRRGVSARDFLTGPRQEVYALSNRYILPGSERVYLDGELLTPGTDYTIIYPAGQLAFLDPERVDDLSIVEVDYEYDVVSRKGLGVISLLDLLPADNEVGAWSRAGEPTLVSEESGLYAQINGAAPKYIDRGWVRSVYGEYRQGSRTIRLAIHDMGSEADALDIFNYSLPPARETVAGRNHVILDIGLPSSYAVIAYDGTFFFELSVDEKSDAAEQSLKLFSIQVLERGESAGRYEVDVPREIFNTARIAISPLDNFEVGARAEYLNGEKPSGSNTSSVKRRRLASGALDSRLERRFGDGGRLTAYGELKGTQEQATNGRDGWGGVGRVRLTHPWVEGAVMGRHLSSGFAPIGSKQALFGELRDEVRMNATAYPTRWLPTSVFVSRQHSDVEGRSEPGVTQHVVGRLQLAHADAPNTSVKVGHTLLDDAAGGQTNRLRLSSEVQYDLATGILAPLGMRRFLVEGLYSLSDSTTQRDGTYAGDDRVEVSRLNLRFAPTTTETAYALFRARRTLSRTDRQENLQRKIRHWELNAGARSAFLPGLVPQLNQSVIFDANRDADGGPTRNSDGTVSAQIGIYPGEWVPALGPVAMDTRYSLSRKQRAQSSLRLGEDRLDRIDNRLSYNGMDTLAFELYQLFEEVRAGSSQVVNAQRLELRNRITYRPVHASPVTLRIDRLNTRLRNNPAVLPNWGRQTTYEASLEWLMRWSPRWTTKIKGTGTTADAKGLLLVQEDSDDESPRTFDQHEGRFEIEGRFLLQRDYGSIFLVQRNIVSRSWGRGDAVIEAWALQSSLGTIVMIGDNLYLDGEVIFRDTRCLHDSCTDSLTLSPRLLLTGNL